jgi:hypothetical protein
LDDDDYALPGADRSIFAVAEQYPGVDLFFHNCVYPDGSTSIGTDVQATHYGYAEWLQGRWDAELKPVVRRRLFEHDQFDNLWGGCEPLLWGRVVRRSSAVVSGKPIVLYDTASSARMGRATGLLRRRAENSAIADEWLVEFGSEVREAAPARWAKRALAASTYHLLCGRRARAMSIYRTIPPPLPSRGTRLAFSAAARLPTHIVRLLFLLQRRELGLAVRDLGIRQVWNL